MPTTGLCVVDVYVVRKVKHVSFLTLQMKNLFCKKLAACLCMKPPSYPSWEPPLLYTRNRYVATGDNRSNSSLHRDDSTENESVKELLTKILNVLETRLHNEKEQNYEDRKNTEMQKDWMLAAAVLDRICAIVFTIIFIGGTLAFIIAVTTHQLSSSSS